MRGFESHRMHYSFKQARVAQLVEHWSNKPTVAGSIPVVSNDKVGTLAEWLRRRPAKPLGYARVGSNPTGVEQMNIH